MKQVLFAAETFILFFEFEHKCSFILFAEWKLISIRFNSFTFANGAFCDYQKKPRLREVQRVGISRLQH